MDVIEVSAVPGRLTRLKFRVYVHDVSAWFGCMLVMLLSQRNHQHVYDVINSYNDSMSMYMPLSEAIVQNTHVNWFGAGAKFGILF